MKQRLVIEPGRAERSYWLELWRYRELEVSAWTVFRCATSTR
jgi:hypothetical protein